MDEEFRNNGAAFLYVEHWTRMNKRKIKSNMGFVEPETVPRRIGFCGSFATDKNFVAAQVAKKLKLPLIEGIPRTYKDMGLTISKNTTVDNQTAMWLSQLCEQIDVVEFVSANTLITFTAYAEWKASKTGAEVDVLLARSLTNLTYLVFNEQYSVAFYTPISGPIQNNGFRSRDKRFQREIDEIILGYLDSFDVDYFPLYGSPRQRVGRALSALDDWGLLERPAP